MCLGFRYDGAGYDFNGINLKRSRFVRVSRSPASVPVGFRFNYNGFVTETIERKLVMLFQCLATLLTWNCFCWCVKGGQGRHSKFATNS